MVAVISGCMPSVIFLRLCLSLRPGDGEIIHAFWMSNDSFPRTRIVDMVLMAWSAMLVMMDVAMVMVVFDSSIVVVW